MQVKPLMKSRPLWGSQFAHKASWFFHRGFINGFFVFYFISSRQGALADTAEISGTQI
jgi:hypothetical protein